MFTAAVLATGTQEPTDFFKECLVLWLGRADPSVNIAMHMLYDLRRYCGTRCDFGFTPRALAAPKLNGQICKEYLPRSSWSSMLINAK